MADLYVNTAEDLATAQPAPLPPELNLPDGRTIISFDKADAEMAAFYGYMPYEQDPVPAYDELTETVVRSLEIVSDVVKGRWTVVPKSSGEMAATVELVKQAKYGAVEDKYQEILSTGFPINLGSLTNPSWQHLAIATSDDKINWSRAERRAEKAIAAGAGDLPLIPIWTTTGARALVTPNHMIEIAGAMEDWALAAMINRGDLIDDVTAATTLAEVEAVDVNAGWPAQGA